MTVGVAILATIAGWLAVSVVVGELVYRHERRGESRVACYLISAGMVACVVCIDAILALSALTVISLWEVPL